MRPAQEADFIFATAVRIMLLTGAACTLLGCLFAWLFGGMEMLQLGFILYAPLFLNAYQGVFARWDAAQQSQRTAKVTLSANLLSAALRGLMIWLGFSLGWLAFSLALEALISIGIALAWCSRRGWLGHLRRWDGKIAHRLLAESLPLLAAQVGSLLLLKVDQMMLFRLRGPAEAGIYAAATRLSELIYAAAPLMITSFMPLLSRAHHQDRALYQRRQQALFGACTLIGYGSVLGWWLVGPQAVALLYGPAFAAAAPVLQIHALATLPLMHGEMRGALLVIEQKTRWSVRCVAAGLALNVLLNLWLIPAYGALGAAWATVFSYTLAWFLSSVVLPPLRQLGAVQSASLTGAAFFKHWRALLS
jgi:O-antigen/teichoic acid export membrane protein